MTVPSIILKYIWQRLENYIDFGGKIDQTFQVIFLVTVVKLEIRIVWNLVERIPGL